jgi:hypothetical protein
MSPEDAHPKCESCGDVLVQSRKFMASTYMYWNRPWGGTLRMSVAVIPYACMSCGRVYLYLGDRKRVIREFKDLPDEEKRKHKGL